MNGAAQHYLEQYQSLARALPGCGVDWLDAKRRAHMKRFAEVGFPTRRDEDWRYTEVESMVGEAFCSVDDSSGAIDAITRENIARFAIDGLRARQLVFIDGLFAPHLSTLGDEQPGVTLASLARMLRENPQALKAHLGAAQPSEAHGFTALNSAHSRDGAFVSIDANTRVDAPIELLFVSCANGRLAQPRNLIVAAEQSRATIIERHVSLDDARALTNSASEIVLGARAELSHYLVQTQSDTAYHVGGLWAKQARDSRLLCCAATLGGALVRNDLGVYLAEPRAHCDMFGVYAARGARHVDNHTTVAHIAEHCTSREWYKGVLTDRARAVFHGRITVHRGAQKTDATQRNDNLLLSRRAEIDTKPQLEIYADDVKCAHGATVGRMNDDALFYLRTRGFDEAGARNLLTTAFVNDVLDEIAIAELKTALGDAFAAQLGPR